MKVPVVWICKKLKKVIRVSNEAVYSGDSGWICDCGEWVDGNDVLHTILSYDNRDSIDELDFIDKSKSVVGSSPMNVRCIGYRCVECGEHFNARFSYSFSNGDVTLSDVRLKVDPLTRELLYGEHKFVIRSINGVWVCYNCYSYGGSA